MIISVYTVELNYISSYNWIYEHYICYEHTCVYIYTLNTLTPMDIYHIWCLVQCRPSPSLSVYKVEASLHPLTLISPTDSIAAHWKMISDLGCWMEIESTNLFNEHIWDYSLVCIMIYIYICIHTPITLIWYRMPRAFLSVYIETFLHPLTLITPMDSMDAQWTMISDLGHWTEMKSTKLFSEHVPDYNLVCTVTLLIICPVIAVIGSLVMST